MKISLSHLLRASLCSLFLGVGIVAVSADQAPPEGSSRVYIRIAPNQKRNAVANIAKAGGKVHHEFDSLGAVAATLPDQAINALRNSASILNIEADPIRYLNSSQDIPSGISAVQAPAAATTVGAGGNNVIVGVIDSGIHAGHEDFTGVGISGYPTEITTTTTTTKGRGRPKTTTDTRYLGIDDEEYWGRDLDSHGTHVSGTIAAVNNDVGVIGVAPEGVDIFMVKVFGDSGDWIYSSSLVSAAQRARDAGAQVINMSLGGPVASSTEQAGMDQLESQDIVLVAASGNGGTDGANGPDPLSYPASYDSVISVAAAEIASIPLVASDISIADFSQKNSQVEIAAPGVGVLSTTSYIDEASITVNGTTYYGHGVEFGAFSTGVIGVLVNGGLADSTNSDWDGKVVLVERGTNSFADKVMNVQDSGGLAAIIFNNVGGELFATLGEENPSTIPAIGITQIDGNALAGQVDTSATSAIVVNNVDYPANGYAAWDGTSMATPHVSGAAALLLRQYPDASPQNIRDAFASSAIDIDIPGKDNASGHGFLQIDAALTALATIMLSAPPVTADPPLISNLALKHNSKKGSFRITWTTDILATSDVYIDGALYASSSLTSSHSRNFRGNKGRTYQWSVSSTSEEGETSSSATFTHDN